MKISNKTKDVLSSIIAIMIGVPILLFIVFTPTRVLQMLTAPVVGFFLLAAVVIFVLSSYKKWRNGK